MKKNLFVLAVILLSGILSACSQQNKAYIVQDEPKSESSGVKKLNLKSQILNKDMNVNIYLPEGYDKTCKYPVLYLLHGYSNTQEWWYSSIGIDKAADKLIKNGKISPIIIVTPLIDNSYGINSSSETENIGGENRKDYISQGMYEDYIYKELVAYIDENYSTVKSREGRYIGGVSAGGYAALHIGFEHNDIYCKIGGHSAALFEDNLISSRLKNFLYPDSNARKDRDPITIAQNKDLSNVKVYLDCGDNDKYQFYNGCEKLNNILQNNGVKSEYHLYSGEHNSSYWSLHVEEYLMFYAGK